MKIRKQVYQLTLDDLERTPVWEFALDEEVEEGQDEATVRPVEGPFPLDPADGMFVVRARFRLGDGTRFTGYLQPPTQGASSLSVIQPTIVAPKGQVGFWFGAFPPKPDVLTASYGKLGKTPVEVFPVAYESDVPLVAGVVRGALEGFAHFRSLKDQTLVRVR